MKTVSLNELVYELLELRRAFLKSTDPLSKRIVVDWIQSQRARLLKQKCDAPMYSIDDHYVQGLGKITMEKVTSTESGIVLGTEDQMWRTTIEIPRTIENKEGKGTFTRIGPSDKLSVRYKVVTYEDALTRGNGKFNHNTIYAFVLGDRIYLTSKSGAHFGIKYLDIRGIFQDPIAAALIATPTWTYDDDYPINKELVDQLKVLIVNEKFGLTLVQAKDQTDNTEDDPTIVKNQQVKVPINQVT
jgi:hypothetical protein